MNHASLVFSNKDYIASLRHLGEPLFLPKANAWAILRQIPETNWHDAAACFPLLVCEHWDHLEQDVRALSSQAVSFTAVTDPLGQYTRVQLESQFKLVRPFKRHWLVDLGVDVSQRTSAHHLRELKRASRKVQITMPRDATTIFHDWHILYTNLIQKHQIPMASQLPEDSIQMLLKVPGIRVYQASINDHIVAMSLWLLGQSVAYYHLAASNEEGYAHSASYALMDHALADLSTLGLSWASLGAGAGLDDHSSSGLARFKRGWATNDRWAYLIGQVCDTEAYDKLSASMKHCASLSYFPSYRSSY